MSSVHSSVRGGCLWTSGNVAGSIWSEIICLTQCLDDVLHEIVAEGRCWLGLVWTGDRLTCVVAANVEAQESSKGKGGFF